MKKALRSHLGWWLLAIAAMPGVLWGFSIEDVLVEPSRQAALGAPVTLAVMIATPSNPTFVYKQTEILRVGTNIFVRVYPAGGSLQSIGTLYERVSFGAMPLGDYAFEVALYPTTNSTDNSGWGRRTFKCNFSIVPTLNIQQSGTNIVVQWPSAATNYVLQTVASLSSSAWTTATDTPGVVGEEYVLTIRATSASQYFRLWRDYVPGPCDPRIPSGAR